LNPLPPDSDRAFFAAGSSAAVAAALAGVAGVAGVAMTTAAEAVVDVVVLTSSSLSGGNAHNASKCARPNRCDSSLTQRVTSHAHARAHLYDGSMRSRLFDVPAAAALVSSSGAATGTPKRRHTCVGCC
jgi:hypothetical protein